MNKASESESCFIFHGFSGVAENPVGGGDVVIFTPWIFFVIFFSDFGWDDFFLFFWEVLKKHVQDIRFSLLQTITIISLQSSAGFFSVDDFSEIPKVGFGRNGRRLVPWRFFLMMHGFSLVRIFFHMDEVLHFPDLKVGSWDQTVKKNLAVFGMSFHGRGDDTWIVFDL